MRPSLLTFLGVVLSAFLGISGVQAQHIHLIDGNLSALKGNGSINIQFDYDNMRVGKYDKEADYISAKRQEYNSKNPGRGDTWAQEWVSDRKSRFEPKFTDLFVKEWGGGLSASAKYTLIIKTTYTEPGYNIAISSHSAEISGEAWIVETANPSNVIAKISFTNAPGRTFMGNDYDTGVRISESYAVLGKNLGKWIRKES